jgi:hypothetical protein
MMHLFVRTTAAAYEAASVKLAEDDGIWTWAEAQTTASPNVQKLELVVGDATLEFTPDEVAAVIARLVRA